MQFPPEVIHIPYPANFTLADNVDMSVAIDSDGRIFYLFFAKVPGAVTSVRLVQYTPQGTNPEEKALPLNPNATAKFMQFQGRLLVLGYYDTYDEHGHKTVWPVAVPVKEAVCPCEIY